MLISGNKSAEEMVRVGCKGATEGFTVAYTKSHSWVIQTV